MARAREAFLTNSLIEIRPVMKVGEYVIGDREVGPITQQLANAYRALVESM